MNKSRIGCMGLLAVVALAGCRLTGASSDPQVTVNPSGGTDTAGPVSTQVEVKTGETKSIDGNYQLAEGARDGEIVHLEHEDGKTVIYGIAHGNVTLKSGETTCGVKVLYNVRAASLSYGTDYHAFMENTLQAGFRGAKDVAYQVGAANPFHFDIGFQSYTYVYDEEDQEWVKDAVEGGVKLDEASTEFLSPDDEFKFSIKDHNINELAEVNADFTLSFKEAAIGQDLELVVSHGETTLSQNVHVNAGYNVYTHEQLKEYFEDGSIVGDLNIQRRIVAHEGDENVFDDPRTPEVERYLYNTNDSEREKDIQGSLYFRYVADYQGLIEDELNELTINANYMVIDAMNAARHYSGTDEIDSFITEDWAHHQASPINGLVCNPQESVFRFYGHKVEREGEPTVYPILNVKNMNLRGNSNTGTAENPELNSDGLIGLMNNSSTMNVENCILDYSVYGAAAYNHEATLVVEDTIISNTWGSSITTYRSNSVTLRNSFLTKAGSAAVWLLNADGERRRNVFSMDEATVIDNYLTATSPWFQAYQLSTIDAFVGQIENYLNAQTKAVISGVSAVDPSVAQLKGHTILADDGRSFNFCVLVQADNDPATAGMSPYSEATVGDLADTVRPLGYGEDTYPNALVKAVFQGAGNKIVKSFGQTDAVLNGAMGQMVPQFMSAGISQADAVNYAYLLGVSQHMTTRDAQGKKNYAQVDADLGGFVGGVGAIIEAKVAA